MSAGLGEPHPERQALLERIARLGVRPFQSQVVQSPWNTVVDAPSLHREVKDRIRKIVSTCHDPEAIRCLTVESPAGGGKTHLLAWTRQMLDERNDAVFIYVPPYTPGAPGGSAMEQHVMRATLDALWLRSRRQQANFERAVRSFLVGCYDRIIDSGQGIKETLLRRDFLEPTVSAFASAHRSGGAAGPVGGLATGLRPPSFPGSRRSLTSPGSTRPGAMAWRRTGTPSQPPAS